MKGVILAGGTGTRLQPFTTILNKHLLPVGPYPMIHWPILRLRNAGIDEIMIITNKDDLSSFIKLLGHGEELNVKLHYKVQKNKGGGIADALVSAKSFIGTGKFVVLLGDNIFEDSLLPYIEDFKEQKIGARILLKEVKDPTRYGVPDMDTINNRVVSIIEKPHNPPSTYCVTGIYMYDHQVFTMIETIHPSSRNELEITDVNNLYIKNNQLQYNILAGWWIDAGTHDSLYKAFQYINEKANGEEIN
ncbi:sugar phosphate nucleotidyltransferase [Lederbergia lenta]|uniref:Glucose-1-phosphate thymidylyltransferase n=1 Tax=Lederbergia lenta TaxID=1467 RepID=A0A2X4WBF8_LEDLE|nr:sugar phosphate nucleotidyltransferase [Lederbergia lenta]MCM3113476.1 sugar phosphate nucleotidyltransferase [Lederbergia lenta]MEC2326716.1 sugar phosphate nucleotidyltransferase [Lederbergia lenta]SQI61496.1 dTDP-glucose pyrophosphorylase [Lederbergia lenta]